MTWALRYSATTGHAPPDYTPLFPHGAGGGDPLSQVRYAAELGLAGVLYPYALERPADEVDQVRALLDEHDLVLSAISCLPAAMIRSNAWLDTSAEGREVLRGHVSRAAELATGLGSPLLAAPQFPTDPPPAGRSLAEAIGENLVLAADIAAEHGLSIGVEPCRTVPIAILRGIPETIELIDTLGRPNIKLIYDTGEVCQMDDDLVGALRTVFPYLALVQLADQPGRVEPGAGSLPLEDVLVELVQLGYTGLVDLEHGWLQSGPEGEQAGLERIREVDRRVRRRVAQTV